MKESTLGRADLTGAQLGEHDEHHPLHEIVHGAAVAQATAPVEPDPAPEAPAQLRFRSRAPRGASAHDRARQLRIGRKSHGNLGRHGMAGQYALTVRTATASDPLT